MKPTSAVRIPARTGCSGAGSAFHIRNTSREMFCKRNPSVDSCRGRSGPLVGERLRAARRERGLSVGALAAAARRGKGSLSEIENGTRNPTLSTLYSARGRARRAAGDAGRGPARRAGRLARRRGAVARREPRRRPDGRGLPAARCEPGVHYRSVAHGPGVTEHLLVTAGPGPRGPPGRGTSRSPGQSAAQWVSDVPHAYTVLGPGPGGISPGHPLPDAAPGSGLFAVTVDTLRRDS